MSKGKIILILIIIAGVITITINVLGNDSSDYNNTNNTPNTAVVGTSEVLIDGVPETEDRRDCLDAGFYFDDSTEECYAYDELGPIDFVGFCELGLGGLIEETVDVGGRTKYTCIQN